MKVLQLVTKRQYRGAEVFAANLSKELISSDIEIVFAGLYAAPDNALTVEGAENIDLNGSKSFFSFSLLKQLKKLVEKEKPDIVQANGSDTLKYAVALKATFPFLPVVYRNISIISSWIGSSFLKKRFYKTLFSKVDHVTSVGRESIADFINTLSYPANKTSVIRRGIPILPIDKMQSCRELRRRFNLSSTDKVVMHVGNFSPEKNHVFLLDVFEGIKQQAPDVKLVLVGEGALFSSMQQQVVSRKLDDTIFFAGFHPNVQELLAGADLFVLCSKVEGVPGVVLEAAAQHVPSLAVNVGGIGEVVEDNQTGILLPGHNKEAFAQSILTLLSDEGLLQAMGEKAHQMVCEEFDSGKNKNTFISLYQSLLNRNSTRKANSQLVPTS